MPTRETEPIPGVESNDAPATSRGYMMSHTHPTAGSGEYACYCPCAKEQAETPDRLAEIEQRWEGDQADGLGLMHIDDFEWLIKEVKRLRYIHCECKYSEPMPEQMRKVLRELYGN